MLAFVYIDQWPRNPGHVLVIPTAHVESLYELETPLAARIHEVVRAVAVAMKQAYACDGVSTRQHNEPAGNQDVWHYHLHVFPRFAGDGLYTVAKARYCEGERAQYAQQLKSEVAAIRSDQAPATSD